MSRCIDLSLEKIRSRAKSRGISLSGLTRKSQFCNRLGKAFGKHTSKKKKMIGKVMKAVKNKITGPGRSKVYDFIRGPITISEHVNTTLGKHIYILGDEHVIKARCPKRKDISIGTLRGLITSAIKANKSDKIDLFLEVDYISPTQRKRKRKEKSYIDQVEDSIKGCLTLYKTGCEYKNVRAHYGDIRDNGKVVSNYGILSEAIADAVDGDLAQAKKTMKKIDPMKMFPISYYDLMDKSKIIKQLKAIKTPAIALTIRKKFMEMAKRYAPTLTEVRQFQEYLEGERKMTKTQLEDIDTKALFFVNSIMDAYLLSRMFRSYATGPDANKIFIYVGEEHAKAYRKFLNNSLGFTTVHISKADNDKKIPFQCVDVTKFRQPLFT